MPRRASTLNEARGCGSAPGVCRQASTRRRLTPCERRRAGSAALAPRDLLMGRRRRRAAGWRCCVHRNNNWDEVDQPPAKKKKREAIPAYVTYPSSDRVDKDHLTLRGCRAHCGTGMEVNVIGAVYATKPLQRGRTSNFVTLELCDEDGAYTATLTAFHEKPERLPACQVGDALRCRRVVFEPPLDGDRATHLRVERRRLVGPRARVARAAGFGAAAAERRRRRRLLRREEADARVRRVDEIWRGCAARRRARSRTTGGGGPLLFDRRSTGGRRALFLSLRRAGGAARRRRRRVLAALLATTRPRSTCSCRPGPISNRARPASRRSGPVTSKAAPLVLDSWRRGRRRTIRPRADVAADLYEELLMWR